MKHNWKITSVLLLMFVMTQLIGLYVINSDPFHIKVTQPNGTIEEVTNPSLSWIQPPEIEQKTDFWRIFPNIIFSFIFAILILFLLIKFKVAIILKGWFLIVIILALSFSLIAILPESIYFTNPIIYYLIPVIIALPLALLKVFKRNFIIHNLTELLIYPGIATIFISILNFWTVIILLVLISIYDMWAVWHSGIMQKMAKYQMNNLKVFAGFFVPYISKKIRMKLKNLKRGRKFKDKKVKVNVAILGGGDVIFPIITSGVILTCAKAGTLPPFLSNLAKPLFGVPGLIATLGVIAGATLGLTLLFMFSQKKKFYPAMPFITAGIFLSLILSYLFL